MAWFRGIIGAVCLLLIAPVLSVAVAGGLAALGGCRLHEGFSQPCVIAGVDLGETLYGIFVVGWAALLTAPLLVLTAILWAVVELIAWRRRARGG